MSGGDLSLDRWLRSGSSGSLCIKIVTASIYRALITFQALFQGLTCVTHTVFTKPCEIKILLHILHIE